MEQREGVKALVGFVVWPLVVAAAMLVLLDLLTVLG